MRTTSCARSVKQEGGSGRRTLSNHIHREFARRTENGRAVKPQGVETHDNGQVSERRYLSDNSMAQFRRNEDTAIAEADEVRLEVSAGTGPPPSTNT